MTSSAQKLISFIQEGESEDDILQRLDSMAYRVQDENLMLPLNEKELEELHEKIADKLGRKMELETEIRNFQAPRKQEIKEIDKTLGNLNEIRRTGYQEREARVFLIQDDQAPVLHMFSERGDYLRSRPLGKNETIGMTMTKKEDFDEDTGEIKE